MGTFFEFARNQTLEQKNFSFRIFKDIVQSLDLTATQLKKIEEAYRGVGTYLANSDNPLLKDAEIYPQGSIRLRTAVKPLKSDEFDIDLILYLPNANGASKDQIMNAVRGHLMDNATYKPMLSELPRGFRINYAGEYHLDITPGKDYLEFIRPGQPLWVPDKREQFKETNSKGLAEWFDINGSKLPKFMQTQQLFDAKANRSLEDIPDQDDKSLLSIFVQVLKRHRDEWANRDGNSLGEYKPISVLITTLATHAYDDVISSNQNYDNEYDVLLDVIERMPHFIENSNGSYYVRNPSMREENYAEKWNRTKDNEGAMLQNAFGEWHYKVQSTVESLAELSSQGTDKLFNSFTDSFGEAPVKFARNSWIESTNQNRKSNNLGVALSTGGVVSLSAAQDAAASSVEPVSKVKSNTFFGS
ncbi:MAG: nucleotidyltransferase [Colwellia sp.]|nr:nucleotidyltransferase [Colwellia sp.]